MTTATKTLWKIDPTHSEVQFKVKHLVISIVTGSFGSYDGQIEADGDNFENAKTTFTADIDSISTNNEDRDQRRESPFLLQGLFCNFHFCFSLCYYGCHFLSANAAFI